MKNNSYNKSIFKLWINTIALVIAISFMGEQLVWAVPNISCLLRPQAALERSGSRKPNINWFKNKGRLKEVLGSVLTERRLELEERQLDLLASRLIERRPPFFGYRSEEHLRRELQHSGIRGVTKAHQEIIVAEFQTGVTRRQADLVIGAAAGILAAGTAVTISFLSSKEEKPKQPVQEKLVPAEVEREAIWIFGYHVSALDAAPVLAELRAAVAAKERGEIDKIIYVQEWHPEGDLLGLQRKYPELGNKLTIDTVENLIQDLNEHGEDEGWLKTHSTHSELWKELIACYATNRKTSDGIIDSLRKAEQLGKGDQMRERIRRLGLPEHLVSIWGYLMKHPEIEVVWERSSLKGGLYSILQELYSEAAIIALYRHGDERRYMECIAKETHRLKLGIAERDRVLGANVLPQVFSNNKKTRARVIISFGGRHPEAPSQVKDYSGFKSRVEKAKIVKPLPIETLEQSLELVLEASQKGDLVRIPAHTRKNLLAYLVSDTLVKFLSKSEISRGDLYAIANSVIERLSLGEVEELTKFLQMKTKKIDDLGLGPELLRFLRLYVITWLNQKGKLNEVKKYLSDSIEAMKVEDVDTMIGIYKLGAAADEQFGPIMEFIAVTPIFGIPFSLPSGISVVPYSGLKAVEELYGPNGQFIREHAERVTELALLIAQRLAAPENAQRLLLWAGLLHDVGFIGEPQLSRWGELGNRYEIYRPRVELRENPGAFYRKYDCQLLRDLQTQHPGDTLFGEVERNIHKIVAVKLREFCQRDGIDLEALELEPNLEEILYRAFWHEEYSVKILKELSPEMLSQLGFSRDTLPLLIPIVRHHTSPSSMPIGVSSDIRLLTEKLHAADTIEAASNAQRARDWYQREPKTLLGAFSDIVRKFEQGEISERVFVAVADLLTEEDQVRDSAMALICQARQIPELTAKDQLFLRALQHFRQTGQPLPRHSATQVAGLSQRSFLKRLWSFIIGGAGAIALSTIAGYEGEIMPPLSIEQEIGIEYKSYEAAILHQI